MIGQGEDVQFITGDEVIDKIESSLAKGGDWPDLIEAFLNPQAQEEAKEWLNSLDERDRYFEEQRAVQEKDLESKAKQIEDDADLHPLIAG